jgi:hypothetical protein
MLRALFFSLLLFFLIPFNGLAGFGRGQVRDLVAM